MAGDAEREGVLDDELEQRRRSSDYWYLASKSMLAVVVRTAGVDAAEALLESVREHALSDFSEVGSEWRVPMRAATDLLEELRRLSEIYRKHESLLLRGDS